MLKENEQDVDVVVLQYFVQDQLFGLYDEDLVDKLVVGFYVFQYVDEICMGQDYDQEGGFYVDDVDEDYEEQDNCYVEVEKVELYEQFVFLVFDVFDFEVIVGCCKLEQYVFCFLVYGFQIGVFGQVDFVCIQVVG